MHLLSINVVSVKRGWDNCGWGRKIHVGEGGAVLPDEKLENTRRKRFEFKPLKETNVDVARALFDP